MRRYFSKAYAAFFLGGFSACVGERSEALELLGHRHTQQGAANSEFRVELASAYVRNLDRIPCPETFPGHQAPSAISLRLEAGTIIGRDADLSFMTNSDFDAIGGAASVRSVARSAGSMQMRLIVTYKHDRVSDPPRETAGESDSDYCSGFDTDFELDVDPDYQTDLDYPFDISDYATVGL